MLPSQSAFPRREFTACLIAFTLVASAALAQPVTSIGVSLWADHDYPEQQDQDALSAELTGQFAARISDRLKSDTVDMRLVDWSETVSEAHPYDWEAADWRCKEAASEARDYPTFHASLTEMGGCLAETFRSEAYLDFYSKLMPEAGVDMVVEIRSFARCPQEAVDEGGCFVGAAVVLVEKNGQAALAGTSSQEICCGTGAFSESAFARPDEYYARIVQPVEDRLGPALIEAIRRLSAR